MVPYLEAVGVGAVEFEASVFDGSRSVSAGFWGRLWFGFSGFFRGL